MLPEWRFIEQYQVSALRTSFHDTLCYSTESPVSLVWPWYEGLCLVVISNAMFSWYLLESCSFFMGNEGGVGLEKSGVEGRETYSWDVMYGRIKTRITNTKTIIKSFHISCFPAIWYHINRKRNKDALFSWNEEIDDFSRTFYKFFLYVLAKRAECLN